MQILFRFECVDEVALHAKLQQHPGGAAREVQAGDRCKVGESGLQALRHRVGRKTEKLEAWKLRRRNPEQGLMPWKRRKQVSFLKEEGTGRSVGRLHGSRG